MRIEKIIVAGLFGRSAETIYNFNDDLNVITGRNGSGKTTLMKLAWFIISGNIIHALREVSFRQCTIVTDIYTCTVVRTGPAHCKIALEFDGDVIHFEDDDVDHEDDPFPESAEDKAKPFLVGRGSSMFFPTFRRIEGASPYLWKLLPAEDRPSGPPIRQK